MMVLVLDEHKGFVWIFVEDVFYLSFWSRGHLRTASTSEINFIRSKSRTCLLFVWLQNLCFDWNLDFGIWTTQKKGNGYHIIAKRSRLNDNLALAIVWRIHWKGVIMTGQPPKPTHSLMRFKIMVFDENISFVRLCMENQKPKKKTTIVYFDPGINLGHLGHTKWMFINRKF